MTNSEDTAAQTAGALARRTFVAGLAASPALGAGAAYAQSIEQWLNEPPRWRREGSTLYMTAGSRTDFWRKTYFGYITDNGHVLHRPVRGDFIATVKVAGRYAAQYDQAGLMIRLDEMCWMKCGVEFVDGQQNISSVFTRDYSDWAGVPLSAPPASTWIRVARKGGALTFSYGADGRSFKEVRQGYLADAETLAVGLMAAAPEGPGFEARFDEFTIA